MTLRNPAHIGSPPAHQRACCRSGAGAIAAILFCCAFVLAKGCAPRPQTTSGKLDIQPASLAVRAARRAFDGAPPTVPHQSFGQECTVCHTERGRIVPSIGVAPANPHAGDDRTGALANCRQCHVFSQSSELFVANTFRPHRARRTVSERAHPAAPPVIPHPVVMRTNCVACHSGVAARLEIRCSHPERTNCTQCHLAVETEEVAAGGLAKLP